MYKRAMRKSGSTRALWPYCLKLMALIRSDKTNSAVSMVMVIPIDELFDPAPGLFEISKELIGIIGSIFGSAKQRLRIGIIVADGGAGKRRSDP